MSDLIRETQKSKSSILWKKSENLFPSEYIHSDKNELKEEKNYSSKIKNSSTLSLHIAAYENFVEAAASDSFEGINGCKNESKFSKTLKNIKDMTLSSAINNLFEFPRQQTKDATNPAVMQFTASQKLLKPNQENAMATTQIDSENPEIVPTSSTSWFSNFDPAAPTTVFSMFTNFAIANMFVYGVTGRARLAYISGVFTIPASLFFSLKAASDDFERWKKMRHLREKGLPVKLMPYPYKFDWEEHEIRLRQKKLERELKNAETLSGTTQN